MPAAPILALPSSTSPSTSLTPNLLPARINHNGPIPISPRHWTPNSTSAFRGRKLLSQTLPVPKNYTGVVVTTTGTTIPSKQTEEEGDGAGEEGAEMREMEEIGKFEEIVVWGHEMVPDRREDVYCRGLEEWVGLAESV
ncbi:uncharacterized protein MYCFIDRAFT_168150, partial [Pseudocercospora fijiensis CIRAD86]